MLPPLPLVSTCPLALPNSKRISLPVALDLCLLSVSGGGTIPLSPYAHRQDRESCRRSYDSYMGRVGYNAYSRVLNSFPAHSLPQLHSHPHLHFAHPNPKHHHPHGYVNNEQHFTLEAGDALDTVLHLHHLNWHYHHLGLHYPHHHCLDAYTL
ncbi:hypothetical protein FB451DRAFT_1397658 [Mycena latifolia]|nr:hypothetical protein FB451DRAFT_1397658 [Mycena latifolia]